MWILIVAMFAKPYVENAVAMTSVLNFSSEKACVTAGEEVARKFETVRMSYRFVCAKQ